MKVSELAHTKELHHAYLVVGNAGKGAAEVLAMLETRGVKTAGNADVLALSFTELSVDNAREISSYASLKSLGGSKYLVVTFSRATNEAQNALLKVVEEAPGGTVFFFSIDSIGHVLPTLQSRAVAVLVSDSNMTRSLNDETGEVKEFLSAGFEERLKMVEKMTAYISKSQDRAPVRAFVKGLLTRVHENGASPQALRDLLDAEKFLRQQGSSVKSVLGHLAVSLPRTRI
ncbi:MAG: hypothetical protein V4437_00595 [Patescibacteria group bacterium]